MFNKPFVVLDLETSGIDPRKDDIIEVAMIRYENGKEADRYESLVSIDYPLDKIITIITGITDEELKENGRPKETVYAEMADFIKGAFVVAHNTAFDVGFLQAKKIKLDVLGYLDTIPLAQICFPELPSYSLESLSDDLDITHENKHRAMSDVEATVGLFKKIWERIEALPTKTLKEIKHFGQFSTWDGSFVFENAAGSSAGSSTEIRIEDQMIEFQGIRRSLDVKEVLGEEGVLQKFWDDYEPREQQVEMAQAVMSAFDEKYHLICEAPTGVGKSLGYLIPAANKAISNKSKVVISTNTINLQQQLYEKDVPLLQKIYQEGTGNPGVRAALLKGRRHYLCLRRLAMFKEKQRFSEIELILLIKILYWQATTTTDDCGEIHLNRDDYLIWDFELCSDQKYCGPKKCKPYGDCYLHRARKKAEDADIIIVNHALLCADLEKDGGLLPDYQYLVIDEAHNFEGACTGAFGMHLKQENFMVPIKAIRTQLEIIQKRYDGTLFGPQSAMDQLDHVLGRVADIENAIDNLFTIVAYFVGQNVQESTYVESLLIDAVIMGSEEWLNLSVSAQQVADDLLNFLRAVKKFLDLMMMDNQNPSEQNDFAVQVMQEGEVLQDQLKALLNFFAEEVKSDFIRWMTSNQSGVVTLNLAPYIPGDLLKERLYGQKKSIVFTSATLGVKLQRRGFDESEQHPFHYFRTMLGLDNSFEELIIDSPFDFEAQAYVLVPNNVMPISSPRSTQEFLPFFEQLIKTVKGNMLSLFTSYRMIEQLYLDLMQPLKNEGTKLLAQRISGGRNKLMKAYMNDPAHSVLFGTSSFWEGVDIKGDALSTLVIHKLPFDVPTDPICKARAQLFSNGFMQYSVPRAILKFRQGFGRLIRSKKDYGVMIVLDNRVLTKEYGKLFLDALPDHITLEQTPLMDIPGQVGEWLDLSRSNL